MVALIMLAAVLPIGLIAASRSRFGSTNPLAGANPPWRWGSDAVGDALSAPIADDTVIDGLIRLSLCIAWAAIAVIVATTVVEVVHALRHHGLSCPDVRWMGWSQSIARFIAVGLVAVLPMITASTSLASTLASRAVPTATDGEPMIASKARSDAGASNTTSSPAPAPDAVHVVAAGESIFSIAVDLAGGEPARILGIADAIIEANLGAVMPSGQRFTNAAYIEIGWALRLPAGVSLHRPVVDPSPATQGTSIYMVERGDTLWDVADEQLGDPTAWPEIWERNAGRSMNGGRTFDDPNLILPGWELELADPEAVVVDPVVSAPAVSTPAVSTPVDADPERNPTPTPEVAEPDTEPANGPLPLTPESTTAPASSTTSTAVPLADPIPAPAAGPSGNAPVPGAPSPIRLEHAALLAAGVLALVGVRRRRRLRAATPHHRVPSPRPDVARTERTLRAIDAGERGLRADVACRAAARSLIGSSSQIGWVEVSADGDLDVRLTAPAALPLPWTGGGQSWRLGAEVPIEILGEDARMVGQPCVALVQLGVTTSGNELLVDLEACGVLAVTAEAAQADEVVTAIATALASSLFAEVAHLVVVSLPEAALLDHRNAHCAASADAAAELACSLVGTTAVDERSSFELRSLRTGGEVWEPAVVLLGSADDGAEICGAADLPAAGHGLAVVVADERQRVADPAARLVARSDGWHFEAFGALIELVPVGVTTSDLHEITELLADADSELEPIDPIAGVRWADDQPVGESADRDSALGELAEGCRTRPHEIVVGILGGVEVRTRTGDAGSFERSKTVELIAWLATHRDRATRTGARTALWDLDVRDATFANVVSEARRGLARLVPPPDGEEWVSRTLTEQLPIHELVVTDAEMVEDRLAQARLQPPDQAIHTLRPAVELVRDMPFAGTGYLWPDAEGITSNLVLLAITVTAEFAGHALSLGDTDAVFWATGKGLRVLPGHEELIALRMQAHGRAGDLAGVRQEWESYERVLVADAWSDGEPAPKLLALRRELLNPTTS
jgi:LysM repeat protein